jgi:hypothetical protein
MASWRVVVGVVLAVAAVMGGVDGAELRAELQVALGMVQEEVQAATPPICYEILKTAWWKARKALNPDVANIPVDKACAIWSQDKFGTRDYCNMRDARQEELAKNRSVYTAAQWDAACIVRGAHDHDCISNPVRGPRLSAVRPSCAVAVTNLVSWPCNHAVQLAQVGEMVEAQLGAPC